MSSIPAARASGGTSNKVVDFKMLNIDGAFMAGGMGNGDPIDHATIGTPTI